MAAFGLSTAGQGAAEVAGATDSEASIAAEAMRAPYEVYEPAGAYVYGFVLPGLGSWGIALKNYLDEMDASLVPTLVQAGDTLTFKATPGEYEPAAFVVYARQSIDNLSVSVSDLVSSSGTIPASAIAVSSIVRTVWRNRRLNNIDVLANRFVMPWLTKTIPAGEFREFWLTAKVPEGAAPGSYVGSVTLQHGTKSASIPVNVTVYPFTLGMPQAKRLGMYHHMGKYSGIDYSQDTARLVSELSDMREHGVTDLVLAHDDVDIYYTMQNGNIVADYTRINHSLSLMQQAGFVNATVVLGSGMVPLGKLLGHLSGITRNPVILTSRAAIEADEQYALIAGQGLAGLESLMQANYPGFKLVINHSDEIFNGPGGSSSSESLTTTTTAVTLTNKTLDYISLSKVVRKVSSLPLYITFHTVAAENDDMRQAIDPWVDRRSHQGFSFQMWMLRLNTIAQYKQELAASGDEAWTYYSPDGPWMLSSWYRIINGLYLWASPFTTQSPYTYEFFLYNPYNDSGSEIIYGFSFPHPATDYQQVATTIWETARQGYDDTRYFLKLRERILAVRALYGMNPTDPAKAQIIQNAADAEAFLQNIERLVTSIDEVLVTEPIGPKSYDAQGNLDFSATTRLHPWAYRTPDESPLINALHHRFDGKSWQKIREMTADYILSLQ